MAAFCRCEDSAPAGGRARGYRGHALADGGARSYGQPRQQLDGQPEQPGHCGGARALSDPQEVELLVCQVYRSLFSLKKKTFISDYMYEKLYYIK